MSLYFFLVLLHQSYYLSLPVKTFPVTINISEQGISLSRQPERNMFAWWLQLQVFANTWCLFVYFNHIGKGMFLFRKQGMYIKTYMLRCSLKQKPMCYRVFSLRENILPE